MKKTLYIGNLASHADQREVVQLLAGTGTVLHLRMMTHDDLIRREGGFAIVEMENEADAIHAARSLHGTLFQGDNLEVRPSTAAEERAAGHPRMFGSMNMADDSASENR